MLQIQIATRDILLDYSIQNARLDLETSRPLVEMDTSPVKIEIRQPQGVLTIDNTPCRYSRGLKNMTDFSRDMAAFARQAGLEGIARIAAEGRRMARIENKANAFAEIAAKNTLDGDIPRLTLARIEAPIIRYEAKPVQLNPIAAKVDYNVIPGELRGTYQPGKVDIQVLQYPEVEVSTIDVEV